MGCYAIALFGVDHDLDHLDPTLPLLDFLKDLFIT